MKNLILAFLLLPSLLAAQTRSVLPKSLILTHVTVIDATGSPAKPDLTVLIRDHRIIAIDRTSALPPNDTEIVDATGKFLIPGLWDMHVHIGRGDVFFPLYIANGGVKRLRKVRFLVPGLSWLAFSSTVSNGQGILRLQMPRKVAKL